MIPVRCVESALSHHIWGHGGKLPQLVGFTESMY
jgi:hypothetical protein